MLTNSMAAEAVHDENREDVAEEDKEQRKIDSDDYDDDSNKLMP